MAAGPPGLIEASYATRSVSDRTAILCEGLTRRFGSTVALDGLTLEVERGEVFGLLGHNGAGKTTTVRLLNGVLVPDGGRARVLGLSPLEEGAELRRRTGVLTEAPSLEERLTGRQNLLYAAELWGVPRPELRERVQGLLDTFGLAERADTKVGGYSRGMKQRLALSRALLHGPDILFLDEPTSGLDPVGARQVHELILALARERGRTILLTTHNLVEAERLCTRVAVLEQGRLVALGTPAELGRGLARAGTVRLRVASRDAPRAREVVEAMLADGAGVTSDGEGSLQVAGLDREAIPEMVARLAAEGVRIYVVSPEEPTLEDVYFALHSRALLEGRA